MRAHEFTDQGAAGIILYAKDTGRYGLQQRSDSINDGGLWAAWGGGREPGESLEQCARRELAEESGYTGLIKLKRLAENPKYVTFIGVVSHEFEPRPDPEWKDYCWVEAGDWPSPMHPGVAAALKNIAVNESKIKLSTDPNWYGAEVGDYQASSPVVNIPANQLVGFEPDDKMNQPASRANVEKIVAGLQQGAKLPPLLVRKYKNGYQVLDGHHRFWAYKLLGVKSIPAQIVPNEDIDISENFADGRVKGKSRPGRVKRAGASCADQSQTYVPRLVSMAASEAGCTTGVLI